MTPKERVRAVYKGETPDQVPLILDLSHWYKKNYNEPFDLSGIQKVNYDLVDLHKKLGAVSYIEMGRFFDLYPDNPELEFKSWTKNGVFHTRIVTPAGTLEEERVFETSSYSYNIKKHLLNGVEDFPVVEYLMDHLKCRANWDYYRDWTEALGDLAYIYVNLPYSGSGYLISRNLGVEKTVFAALDYPEEFKCLIDSVNTCNLRILDTIIDGPFDTLIISDNYDSNIQPEKFFNLYVREYYMEVAERLHKKGKYLAIHVDGESRGVLKWLAECGVDCADAVTPAPMFALTPAEMREQAGPELILSGGIPASEIGFSGSDQAFIDSVKRWLETKHTSSRLLMAAGDQIPTDAPWERIAMLPELIDKYGKY